jgi:hypothetical protein
MMAFHYILFFHTAIVFLTFWVHCRCLLNVVTMTRHNNGEECGRERKKTRGKKENEIKWRGDKKRTVCVCMCVCVQRKLDSINQKLLLLSGHNVFGGVTKRGCRILLNRVYSSNVGSFHVKSLLVWYVKFRPDAFT